MLRPYNPGNRSHRFGLFRFRSPLLTESISLSIPPLTEMFHFSGYRVYFPILFRKQQCSITCIRLPHSEISGSKRICRSPKLIAAYHVLHRLIAPRHSLCALYSLFTSPYLKLLARIRLKGFHQARLVHFTPFFRIFITKTYRRTIQHACAVQLCILLYLNMQLPKNITRFERGVAFATLDQKLKNELHPDGGSDRTRTCDPRLIKAVL